MKRNRSILPSRMFAATLLVASMVGCASFNGRESIVRVNAKRDSAKASRLTNAGIKAMQVGAPDEAIKKFAQAIAADHTYGPAHNNLGLAQYEQGSLYDAVLSFEQAMEFLPHDPTVYYNLGLALEAAGKTQEAMDLYHQAVEMDPANANFLGNLVRLRVRMGESDPSLVAQLQDLVLIEHRPSWRRWADYQLALNLNDSLDRGPPTPEFNTNSRRDSSPEAQENVIDLTPPSDGPQTQSTPSKSEPRILSGPEIESTDGAPLPVPKKDPLSIDDDRSTDPGVSEYFR